MSVQTCCIAGRLTRTNVSSGAKLALALRIFAYHPATKPRERIYYGLILPAAKGEGHTTKQ